MVNYGAINNICQQIRSLGFEARYQTKYLGGLDEHYVGFDVYGIASFSCWRSDEQVAINCAAEKLRAVLEGLTYWHNVSTKQGAKSNG